MGLQAGIKAWQPWLKPRRHLAVSESPGPAVMIPAEAGGSLGSAEYPEVGRASEKASRSAGNQRSCYAGGLLILPQASWEEGATPRQASLRRPGTAWPLAEACELSGRPRQVRLYRTHRAALRLRQLPGTEGCSSARALSHPTDLPGPLTSRF